jgi:tRNA nucleotidyltransferase (CCA-adding enzyme)
VIGLLTRRAVDRALSHKLNATAEKLMDAGEVFVHPDDSIESLQHLMTESGWGQIPVVQPETGAIIGIVTRTDLLKTLTREPRLPSRQNLAGRVESVLPAARLALLKAVARCAHQHHTALYIVGGFVRDLLLERPSLDFDLVVEGDAIELGRALAAEYGGRVTSHARFGTAKWHIAPIRTRLLAAIHPEPAGHLQVADLPASLDLISARTEFYTYPTALPTVERGSIKLDLHRRDFTINTLALRLDGHHYGELHDYWGGLTDLRLGLVRVLHSLSFVDDPTRMLRAVRFEQRFDFHIEERTLELMEEARPLMVRVSGDRIRHELDHILGEERVCQLLERCADLNLLQAIHEDLEWDGWLSDQIRSLTEARLPETWDVGEMVRDPGFRLKVIYVLWLIRLASVRARSVITRLKLSRELGEIVLAARSLWRDLPSLENVRPSQVVARLDGVPQLALYANYLTHEEAALRRVLDQYVTVWRHVTPVTDGYTLRERGLPPSPVYRQILAALRNAWLDGRIGSAEEEAAYLDQIIKEGEFADREGIEGRS